jgi:hypothetical protein
VTFAFISLIMATDGASPSSSTLGSSSILRDSSHSKRRTNADTLHESMRGAGNVVVRFYLIRHGQTDANIKGLVLGQTDSVRISNFLLASFTSHSEENIDAHLSFCKSLFL